MIVALLFNSDHPNYGGFYGPPIRNTILQTNILQISKRHLKISIGDVLIYSNARDRDHYIKLSELAYFSHPWRLLKTEQLIATFFKATVYAWVIQNITAEIAEALHIALLEDDAYLGMHGVNYANPIQLVLYRNSMISKYRIKGTSCNVFFSMGSEDEKDEYEVEELKELGFTNVEWEDKGAHHTIFDDYDTIEHFKQIREFQLSVATFLAGGEDEAEELVMMLEDLNPKLFNTLGAAVRALSRAVNEEDLAQVGLSGRRYIEQLADVLFPAQAQLANGRKVTQDKFKNRIWAYIEMSLPIEDSTRIPKIETLGKETDRLIDEVNAAVHGGPSKERILKALGDLAKLTVALLELNPTETRKPYFAFQNNIENFLKETISASRTNQKDS